MRKAKLLRVSMVERSLATKTIGHPILYFRELTSTNDMAKGLATRKEKEGTVVLAETQTEGREDLTGSGFHLPVEYIFL